MASEMHKKRTGKGLKITEEIVLKEEIYEEDGNDLLRSYRLRSPDVEALYNDGRTHLEACSSNKAEVSQMLARTNDEWQGNDINRLFAQYFPNTVLAAQRVTQLMPSAATCQQSLRGHSQTTFPTSYSQATWIAAPAGPPPPSASNNDHLWMSPNMSTTGNPSRDGIQSIYSTVSPWPPVDLTPPSKFTYTKHSPSEEDVVLAEPGIDQVMAQAPTIQETQEYHGWRTMCDAPDMLKAAEIDEADPKLVPDQYGYGTDKTIADTSAVSRKSNDNSWQGIINQTVFREQRHRYEAGTMPPRERNVQTIVERLAEMDKALRCFGKLQQEAIEASGLPFNLTENGRAKHEPVHNEVLECRCSH